MNILIKNVDILTCDKDNEFIKSGSIGIKDGIIDFVASDGQDISGFKADRIIEGKHRIAMPGLVNTHTHAAMTLLRNYGNDLALEEWLFDKIFPAEAKLTPDYVYWGTMLGVCEMIKSGTTAFADMYYYMDEVARVVSESGIRANICKAAFKYSPDSESKMKDIRDDCIRYYKEWNNHANGRIKVWVEIHSVYLYDADSLEKAAALAKELNTGIHIHILETQKEVAQSIQMYGMTSVETCEKYGVLDVPVLAAHCVHLSDKDMEIFKKKNVSVAHNPTSNLKLGSGIARVPYMLEKGINVALGTDGTASNNNLDMFEEMNLAALIHKGVNMNPQLVSAGEAIRMATVNGAKAIGFGNETGCIKKGMKADLILLDTDKPHFYPMNDVFASIVYAAKSSDVDTVIVDGKILMENRELKTIDEEKAKYMTKAASEKILGL